MPVGINAMNEYTVVGVGIDGRNNVVHLL